MSCSKGSYDALPPDIASLRISVLLEKCTWCGYRERYVLSAESHSMGSEQPTLTGSTLQFMN